MGGGMGRGGGMGAPPGSRGMGMPGAGMPGMVRPTMGVGMPGGMPGGMPRGMPGGMPGGLPGGMPRGLPGGLPGGMPGGMPRGMPHGMPGGGGFGGMQQPWGAPAIPPAASSNRTIEGNAVVAAPSVKSVWTEHKKGDRTYYYNAVRLAAFARITCCNSDSLSLLPLLLVGAANPRVNVRKARRA